MAPPACKQSARMQTIRAHANNPRTAREKQMVIILKNVMIITEINTYIYMKIYVIIIFYNAFDHWLKGVWRVGGFKGGGGVKEWVQEVVSLI